jgi:putative PIN family toxin of toxin-antitoxin system
VDDLPIYAVIDTNVIISSLLSSKSDTATVVVIEQVLKGNIVPLYSKEIIEEYSIVLNRKKFGFSATIIDTLLNSIRKYGIEVNPTKVKESLPDIKDMPFYEVVMDKRKDNTYLVTGNIKHFPSKPSIVTPKEMLDIVKMSQH